MAGDMKKETTIVQPAPSRGRTRRKTTNGTPAPILSPALLAGTKEPDAQVPIHPIMLKRLEWLAEKSGTSPACILDEMLWCAMEQESYAVPDMGGWTPQED